MPGKNASVTLLLIIFPVLFLLFSNPATAQDPSTKRPRIALVLSGGGAKGFAHIGVLKVIEEEKIPVDIIVGTSMGSIVGGFYSIGYTSKELEDIVKNMNWENVLTDEVPRSFLSKHDQLLKQRYVLSLPVNGEKKLTLPQGLIRGYNVMNIFCGLAGNVPSDADFGKFPVSFACVAADLQTGREVVMNKGFLPTALYSSMAIPIIFQPAARDGALLLDGGLLNNFPTDVAKKMGADIIIGVDIRNDLYEKGKLPTLGNVVGQIANFFDMSKDSINRSYCNLIIRPEIKGFNFSSFSRTAADSLIERGYKAACNSREKLRELKETLNLAPRERSRDYIKPDKWHLTGLQFTGDSYLDQHYMSDILNLDLPGDYSNDDIKNAIDRLYGLGGFDYIYYDLPSSGEGRKLNLNLLTNKIYNLNVGFKANTVDNSAILLNITRKNYSNTFGLFSASAELSVNPGLSVVTEFHQKDLPALGLLLRSKYQKYKMYGTSGKISETEMMFSCAGIYLHQPFKKFNLNTGIQEEYYSLDNLNVTDNYPYPDGKSNFIMTNLYTSISFDSMDDYYYARRGTNIYLEFSILGDFRGDNKYYPTMLFSLKNVIPLRPRTALLLDLHSRFIFSDDIPQPKTTFAGGEPYNNYFNYQLPFVGLRAVNTLGRHAYVALAGLRIKLAQTHYISLLVNGLMHGNELLSANNSFVLGGGIKYSMKTLLGPLDVTIGYSDYYSRPSFSAGFGYWF